MKLDREKLNLILIASDAKDESGEVLIRKPGGSEKDAGWVILPAETGKKFYRESKQNEKGDIDMVDIDFETLLREVEGKEVDLLTNWDAETMSYERFSDWDSFAKAYGALDLEVLSTKVPRPVARYFRRFAGSEGVSARLRKLVYEYVQGELKERAASLMFEE